MANNLTIYPQYSPRLIIVDAPDTEETMQNLVDDVRTWEHIPANLSYPKIIDASGKEPLGGGVLVGITVKLNDAKLGFAPRNDSVSTGTVTTLNTGGVSLIDSGADFVSDNVQPGATIINFTDKSVATVLEIVSATEITCLPLSDGTDDQFQVNDEYKIWNIIQVEATGGNLTAVDDVGADISSIFPTAFTQVVRTSSSSATLQELEAVQYASFNGGVTIDFANITGRSGAGTQFPTGTPELPVDNLADLGTISSDRGLFKVFVIGDLTLTTDHVWDRNQFEGESANKSILTIPGAVSVDNCEFRDFTITGTLDGNALIERSVISTLAYVEGFIFQCAFAPGSTTTLGNGTIANILQCYSGEPGPTTPTIDCGGTGIVSLRDYNGGMKFINYSGSSAHSIDLASGQIVLDSATITGGTWVVRGIGKLIDENGNPIDSDVDGNGRPIPTTWNGTVTILNELLTAGAVGGGGGSSVWSTAQRDAVIQYSKKSSDNAEQANLKL